MNKCIIKFEILSDTLLGSGEGLGANIDKDIIFDELGIPYIPGKRIKGVLKDAIQDTIEMLGNAKITFTTIKNSEDILGKPGQENPSKINFSNLYLTDFPDTKKWLKYLKSKYPNSFSKEVYINYFTTLRHQTKINEKGIAKKKSLRTSRVLKSGFEFEGTIEVDNNDKESLIALACLNLRNIGLMRNRGFGEVKVTLLNESSEDLSENALSKLEGLCSE